MKIYIDAGHGGSSIGATYKGRKEQDDCLKLALAVRDLLIQQKDVEVKLSRTTSVNPSISKRCSEANAWGANYFISIHRNAIAPNKGTGAEIWIYSKCKKDGNTYKMAEKILKSLCSATGFKNRGVKLGAAAYTDYGVNSGTKMSSCLVEVGFVDNDNDNAIFDNKFNDMAKAIAKSLYEVNGGKWSEINTKLEFTEEVPVVKNTEIKVGCTVKLKKGAKTFNGGNLASFVYERNHKVKEINIDRVVITYNGIVIAAVKKSDLILID